MAGILGAQDCGGFGVGGIRFAPNFNLTTMVRLAGFVP
jgi:hypothetical protein